MWVGTVLSLVIGAVTSLGGGPGAAGDAACPSETEVDAELARLGAERGTRPDIFFEGDRMHVVLRGRDGKTIGSREVESPATCRERATVAAIFVATWMGIWPEGPKTASAPPPPTISAPPASPPQANRTSVRRAEIGLAVMGSFDGNAMALGASVAARRSLIGPLRGYAGLTYVTERERRVGPGLGKYSIPAIEVGPALGLERGRVRGEIGVSARLGALIVRGTDLPTTYAKVRAVPGMAANLLLIMVSGRLSPFVVVGGSWWFGRHTLALDNDTAIADVPGWDAQVGLGALWALGL